MKLLLTGASGYVGQAFLKELQHTYSIRTFGRTPIEEGIDFFKGDITIYEDVCRAAAGVDVIVHLAALGPAPQEHLRDGRLFDVNVKGTFNILRAAADANVKKVVYASSICAVGFEGLELPVKECAKPNPSDGLYGLSKYFGEQLCESYSKWHGISTLCLRIATIVPQHDIILPSAPNTFNWYGYVDISDVVQALDLSIRAEGITHGVFHICAENSAMKYDITEAKRILGFHPIHNNEELIAEANAVPELLKTPTIAIEGRILQRNVTGSERYISELVKNIKQIGEQKGYNTILVNDSGYDSLNTPTIPAISPGHRITLYHRTYQFATNDELSEYLLVNKRVFTFLDLILCKYPDYFPNNQAFEDNKTKMRLALHLSTRIIAISEHAKQDVVDTFGIPPDKVDVVYLGLDSTKFKHIDDADAITSFRREHHLPAKYILNIGTDYPHKNLSNLLIAFAKVADREDMKDYSLVLAGNNYYIAGNQYLNTFIEPIQDRLIRLGHFDDNKLTLLYNAADMFVFPSLYEGFGLPVLEAFACEVPVICSTATSLPEVAGDAAYMVDATAPDQIARAMLDIAGHPELRQSLIDKGRTRVRQFTWLTCAENTYKVYERALTQQPDIDPAHDVNLKLFFSELAKGTTANPESAATVPVTPKRTTTVALLKLFCSNVKREGFLSSARKALKYLYKLL